MSLMLPAYGLYGFAYYWPSWVHLLVIALMVVAGSLTLKALAARSAGRSRVYGLSCGFVAGLGNLSLCVLGQAEARHVWQLGTVIAIYAVVAVCGRRCMRDHVAVYAVERRRRWLPVVSRLPHPPACRYSRLGRSGDYPAHAVLDSAARHGRGGPSRVVRCLRRGTQHRRLGESSRATRPRPRSW